MRRVRRTVALVVAATIAFAPASLSSRRAEAHDCVVVSTPTTTLTGDPQCRAEAETTPPDHMCTTFDTVLTVVVCRETAGYGSGTRGSTSRATAHRSVNSVALHGTLVRVLPS
jgi:hypothetical protein